MTSQLNFPPVKEELLTANVWKLTSVPSQSIRESASTEDYTLNKLLILAVEVNRRKVKAMRNDEIMTLKLERIKVIDLEMAINSIISDFEAEINAPETTEDRKKIAKSAIDRRWKPLLKTIQDQFEEQDI